MADTWTVIDREKLRDGFKPATDIDLLEAAEIGGLVAKFQKDKFNAAKLAFETAETAARNTGQFDVAELLKDNALVLGRIAKGWGYLDTAQKFVSIYYKDGALAASYNFAKNEIISAISNGAGSAVGRTVFLQLTRGTIASVLGGPVSIGIAVGITVGSILLTKSVTSAAAKSIVGVIENELSTTFLTTGGDSDAIAANGIVVHVLHDGGYEVIDGQAGYKNVIVGSDVADELLLTNSGYSTMILGGGGDDTITNVAVGALGDNASFYGQSGNDTLIGSDNRLSGDLLVGGEDNDTLIGRRGNDTIDGGLGNDTIDGGGDDDKSIYTLSSANPNPVETTTTRLHLLMNSGANGE
ncbi:MAG: calcium-binding protein, partial [bacterium]|nr:calcium-binding protein [bacterium]